MPGSQEPSSDLREDHFQLIHYVVQAVVSTGEIPTTKDMADALGLTRQGVLRRMESAARAGLIPPRPRYATRWFALTKEGELAYAGRLRSMRSGRALRKPENQ